MFDIANNILFRIFKYTKMIVRPITWSLLGPWIQCFALDEIGRRVYFRFKPSMIERPTKLKLKTKLIELARHKFLSEYFHISKINPYDPIVLDSYYTLNSKFTDSEIELYLVSQPRNYKESFVGPEAKKLFWDIETYSSDGNFTVPSNPENFISNISAVVVDNQINYGAMFASVGPIDRYGLKVYDRYPMTLYDQEDEAGLLYEFSKFWSSTKPDLVLSYNGDGFDMPYLIERYQIHEEIEPPKGHILKYSPKVVEIGIPTPLPHRPIQKSKTWIMPDLENIDMLLFVRRFEPGLVNSRLETVAQKFLGEGKTGLGYSEMFEIIRTRDPVRLPKLIDYSYFDSILLSNLEQKLDMVARLTQISNTLRILRPNLLRMTDHSLVRYIFEMMDPGYRNLKLKLGKLPTLKTPLILVGVKVVDYKPNLLQIFEQYVKEYPMFEGFAEYLIPVLKVLPTHLIVKIFSSNWMPQRLWGRCEVMLFNAGSHYDENYAYRLTKESPDYKVLIAYSRTKTVRLTLDNQVEFHKVKVLFPLLESVYQDYALNLWERQRFELDVRKFPMVPAPYVMESKLTPENKNKGVRNMTLTQQLSESGIFIKVWIKVPYLKTLDGYALYTQTIEYSELDHEYYHESIRAMVTKLENIVVVQL